MSVITSDRREWREGDHPDPEVAYRLSFRHHMFMEKWCHVLSLAGDLMLWLTEIHADALQNSWPEKPPQVTRWTAAALTASATVNPVQVPLRRQLRRCACVVSKPADPMCPTCDELVKPDAKGKPTTTKCDHWIGLAEVREKLHVHNDGQRDTRTVLQVVCGSHRWDSPEGRSMLIAKLEDLKCFTADHTKDAHYFANPTTSKLNENDVPIQLVVNASYRNSQNQPKKHGVRGLYWVETDNGQFGDEGEEGAPASASATAQ